MTNLHAGKPPKCALIFVSNAKCRQKRRARLFGPKVFRRCPGLVVGFPVGSRGCGACTRFKALHTHTHSVCLSLFLSLSLSFIFLVLPILTFVCLSVSLCQSLCYISLQIRVLFGRFLNNSVYKSADRHDDFSITFSGQSRRLTD